VTVVPASVAWLLILLYIGLPPSWRRLRKVVPAATSVFDLAPPTYSRIGVALDYSDVDGKVLAHALTLAKHHAAEIFLFHIVEGVSGQLYGKEAFDGEARSDPAQLSGIAEQLRKAGAQVRTVLGFGRVPTELVRLARDSKVDLIVMGAHGHRGLMDIFFGTSISEVRHQLTVPVLVVQ
jgi:manganese transport protein